METENRTPRGCRNTDGRPGVFARTMHFSELLISEGGEGGSGRVSAWTDRGVGRE